MKLCIDWFLNRFTIYGLLDIVYIFFLDIHSAAAIHNLCVMVDVCFFFVWSKQICSNIGDWQAKSSRMLSVRLLECEPSSAICVSNSTNQRQNVRKKDSINLWFVLWLYNKCLDLFSPKNRWKVFWNFNFNFVIQSHSNPSSSIISLHIHVDIWLWHFRLILFHLCFRIWQKTSMNATKSN